MQNQVKIKILFLVFLLAAVRHFYNRGEAASRYLLTFLNHSFPQFLSLPLSDFFQLSVSCEH